MQTTRIWASRSMDERSEHAPCRSDCIALRSWVQVEATSQRQRGGLLELLERHVPLVDVAIAARDREVLVVVLAPSAQRVLVVDGGEVSREQLAAVATRELRLRAESVRLVTLDAVGGHSNSSSGGKTDDDRMTRW